MVKTAASISTFNPLSARIFTDFGRGLLEGRVLHKKPCAARYPPWGPGL